MGTARKALAVLVGSGLLVLGGRALALDAKSVEGTWVMDEAKTKAAKDGHVVPLMAQVIVKADGTFEAKYGTTGTWKVKGEKLDIRYSGSPGLQEDAMLEGEYLKFASPSASGKFVYLKKK